MVPKKSFLTLTVLLISVSIIAIISGSIVNFFSLHTDYSYFIALCGALIAGSLSALMLSLCRIKTMFIALLYSFLVGSCVYLVHMYGDYIMFEKEVTAKANISDPTYISALTDIIIKSETNDTGILEYMHYISKVGILTKSNDLNVTEKRNDLLPEMEICLDWLIYEITSVTCGCGYVLEKKLEGISLSNI